MVHGEVSYLPYSIELGTFPLSITFSSLLFCLTSKCIASFPLMLTEKALKKKENKRLYLDILLLFPIYH